MNTQWFEEAASQGYVPAYYETALAYFNTREETADGLWHENDLAKTYMWLAATLQRSQDEKQLASARRMMETVTEVMPASWAADLDSKVQAHLLESVVSAGNE